MRWFYAFIACCLYGGMCGLTTAAAQDAQRARKDREDAEGALLFYRTRVYESERMLESCIVMYSDAEKTNDRCHKHLKACLGVTEFGK